MGHLLANGFEVEAKDVADLQLRDLKARYGVTGQLAACHTAVVNGYVIEGHVPADVIATLLAERPDLVGLAVPGMPIGSPGMEGPNPQPYDVLAFDEKGRTRVYSRK